MYFIDSHGFSHNFFNEKLIYLNEVSIVFPSEGNVYLQIAKQWMRYKIQNTFYERQKIRAPNLFVHLINSVLKTNHSDEYLIFWCDCSYRNTKKIL